MRIFILNILFFTLFVSYSQAAESGPYDNIDLGKSKVFSEGIFRVIYSTIGEDAVDSTDKNANGIPDPVENIL